MRRAGERGWNDARGSFEPLFSLVAVLLETVRVVTGDATGVGVRNGHGLAGIDALHILVVLARDDEQVGGDIVFPVVLAVLGHQATHPAFE